MSGRQLLMGATGAISLITLTAAIALLTEVEVGFKSIIVFITVLGSVLSLTLSVFSYQLSRRGREAA